MRLKHRTSRGQTTRVILVLAMIAGMFAVIAPTAAQAATVEPYTGLSFRLQGCKGDAGLLPNGSGKFICDDSLYTDGNLGKGWNELDLVPHRIIVSAGTSAPASQTYHFDIAADNVSGTKIGYDFIENGFEATSGCSASIGTQQTISGLIYREITVTQARNTTCQLDLYIRLGLGAHLWPGSSLHSQLLNNIETTAGIGEKTNSIPVNQIAPQSISKDMSASQGSDNVWNVTKSTSNLNFGDTCATDAVLSKHVDVTISWTKTAGTPGAVTVTTNIYATNPAHRTITVNVTDKIYSGTTQTTLLDTKVFLPVDVPGESSNFLIGTHTFVWDPPTAGVTHLNDVATATYTDKVTGFPVPGTTTATAGADIQVTTGNDTATVHDEESITGTGLTFSVAGPPSGSFDGYTAGDKVTGPVKWDSGTLSSSGSVTFDKTVYLASVGSTTGSLSDTATLTASGGFTKDANASVGITASADATITVKKSIPDVLGAGDADQTFTFDLTGDATGQKTITFGQGEGGAGNYKTVDFTGLVLGGSYTVTEEAATGYGAQNPATVASAACSNTVTFDNTRGPASARVAKDTDPDGSESGWTFDLHSGDASGPIVDTVTTTSSAFANFTGAGAALAEGTYTITEQSQTGWTNTGNSGQCSFTVNYPGSADAVFSCTFANKSRGHVAVKKTVGGATTTDVFTFELRHGVDIGDPLVPGDDNGGTLDETESVTANNTAVNFTTDLIPGTTYTICEFVLPGWSTNLPSQYTLVLLDNNVRVCSDFTAGFGTTFTFTVDNTRPPGGEQRTIGFWKNWASCNKSNGKQKPVLDQTLTLADANGGITLGKLTLHAGDCVKAVNILNKTTIDGKKKMASDPLFNMAAQLLAADLNVVAGAGTCPAATTAINAAQALLLKYNWDGLTYSPKLTSADAALANQLATTLDQYNNGLLC
jgi:hypothetical protein